MCLLRRDVGDYTNSASRGVAAWMGRSPVQNAAVRSRSRVSLPAGRSVAVSATACSRSRICRRARSRPGSAGDSGGRKWVRWAWMAIAVVAVVGVTIGGIRFVRRQYRSAREGVDPQAAGVVEDQEDAGQLGMALVDLDAALDLARRSGRSQTPPRAGGGAPGRPGSPRSAIRAGQAGPSRPAVVSDGRMAQPARPVAEGSRSQLARWRRIEEEFRRVVQSQADLRAGHGPPGLRIGAGRGVAPGVRPDRRSAAAPPRWPRPRSVARPRRWSGDWWNPTAWRWRPGAGDFVHGSFETYRATLTPMLVKALESKGYLPFRESSPWKSAWDKAMYRMRLEVSERREGNYLSTENRLTRIEARLTLTSSSKLVWQTIPTARTNVPLPDLPVYLSSRLAANPTRSEECRTPPLRQCPRTDRREVRLRPGKHARVLSRDPGRSEGPAPRRWSQFPERRNKESSSSRCEDKLAREGRFGVGWPER